MYISTQDVAERFSVSTSTVRNWANAGQIPSYLIGGSMRFLIHDVNNFARPRPVRTREVPPPHDQFDAQQAS